jgi:S1-C subfamily serine protease
MTGLDWVIVGLVLLLAVFGWAQGFVAGALALVGFAAGAWIGTRVGPLVLPDGAESPYAPAFGLLGALFAGAVVAAGFEGLGWRLRGKLRAPGLAAADGLLGAALTACAGLGVCWVLGAVAVHSAGGELRAEVQRSTILRELNELLPPSGPLLNVIARFDPFPRVTGPEAQVPAPRSAIAADADVRAAGARVVKVLGPGLVVTNAHVVAGQDDTRVLLRGREPGLPAGAVAFDPRNDLAVLRVPGLGAPALSIAREPRVGASAAILGFPLNGPYDVRAARVGQTRTVLSQDAYGRGPLQRQITSLRGLVRSGNSGGPVVDASGRVVTTVFAASTSGPRGGYGVPNAVVRDALQNTDRSVSTGPCAG